MQTITWGDKLWEPTKAAIEASHMRRFATFAEKKFHKDFATWDQLYRWSLSDLADFWGTLAEFTQVKWRANPRQPLEWRRGTSMREARWFPGAQLNFAENLLPSPSTRTAIVALSEEGQALPYSCARLYSDVAACALSLQKLGVQKGDIVAAALSSGYEAIVAMLASTALGAVWSSCSPDFGVAGIVDRFGQIEPKVIFWQSRYSYQGRTYDCQANLNACLEQFKQPFFSVLVNRDLGLAKPPSSASMDFSEFLAQSPESEHLGKIPFVPTAFDHPLYIMFSSGTTGKPKAIVHGVGGTLLQHKKELHLHCNLDETDRLLFYTTCGWMMWNWMVSALSLGTTIVTYDGSPSFPDLGTMWRLVESQNLTVLGTSPKFLSACMQAGVNPKEEFDLSSLRMLLATGAPLLPEHYGWSLQHIKQDLHVASISGGTDILSCFMLANPYLPVYAGEIQGPGLGMDIHAWDDGGKELLGKKGELVCSSPFVSMPLGFLHDPEGKKFQSAYFDYFPGRDVWRHGDYCAFTPNGGVIIYGRSDATLNPGGVRIGTSELYRQVELVAAIADSVAVELRGQAESQIVLFVTLKDGFSWKESIAQDLRQIIRKNLTPRHVPQLICPVTAIPYTRSGKKVELAVSKAIHGETVENTEALVNPEALQQFYDWGKAQCSHPERSEGS